MQDEEQETEPTINYVDPFIGTGAHGHTYPGATVPFGMVQLSPDNGVEGWDWCSGYHYSDSIVVGFSHTHLSGTGIGDLADVSLMPTNEKIDLSKKILSREDIEFSSKYSHDSEISTPGFYQVDLLDRGIKVSLTASTRCGFQKYEFNENSHLKSVILNLAYAVNWDSTLMTSFRVINNRRISGYRYSTGWAKDQRIHFAIDFSEPFEVLQVANGVEPLGNDLTVYKGREIRAQLAFPDANQTVMLKTGVSSASESGAIESLGEIQDWDFDKVKESARETWKQELDKIWVKDDDGTKKTFYTALYHTKLAPVIYSDPSGNYKGANGKINHALGYTRYDIFSLWDTYRAAHPLFTILEEDRVNDMIRSLLAHYEEYGLLPVWSLLGNETNTMTGYHAIPVITDAYFKGFKGFEIEEAYKAMKASAMQDIRGVQFYKEFGFIPSELEVESVTKNLEYAYDDWCIAQVAKSLNYTEDYDYFLNRSQSFTHLFDTTVGFMRGKLSSGKWVEPFDPRRSEHRVNTDYTEGNAWQHTWYVPHNVPALIELMGGNQNFIKKLDSLFTTSSEITGDNVSSDISGLIGQYAHGNEPSHHVAYLYSYAGAPWKTQEIVRKILSTQYNNTPSGLCGNDDCGQMSAWYIFSALGFYPVNPANGIYVLGSPLFENVAINLDEGKQFEVAAENNSEDNVYIQSAKLNGEPYNKPYISHADIMRGGKLVFQMGNKPNKNWGTDKKIPESLNK